MSEPLKRLAELASRQDLKAFKEAWAEAIANHASNVKGLLDAISPLESQGQFQEAGICLKVLLPTYLEHGQDQAALAVLRRLGNIAPRESGVRTGFLKVYRRKYSEHPAVEVMIRHAALETSPDIVGAAKKFEGYIRFAPGSYVEHPAGWGVGIVRAFDTDQATVTIDFRDMPGHQLSLEMAQSITRHLVHDHFRAMKFDRLDELKGMAENDAARLVRCAVTSRDRATTLRDVRDLLTDGIVPAKDWSRWWTKTKALIKRDNNVKFSTGNNPTIEVTMRESSFEDTAMTQLTALGDLPARVKFVRELYNELEAHPETKQAIIMAAAFLAGASLETLKSHPGATLSLALMLERVHSIEPSFEVPDHLQIAALIDSPPDVLPLLESVPIIADRREILSRWRERYTDEWPDFFEQALYIGETDIGDHCMRELLAIGGFDRLTRVIFELQKRFREHRAAFAWYVRVVSAGKLHAALPNPGLSVLFEKTLILHSHVRSKFLQSEDNELRKEFKSIEKTLQNRNYEITRETLRACDARDAVNFYNMVRTSRSLPEDVKDGMIAAILRTRPEVARERALAEELGAPMVDDKFIYVSPAGYLKYETEFNKLVNDDIPMNAKEIGRAASHGDLSENAEWTAAIEKQTMLTRRAEDMRSQIERARVLDAATISDETVSVGCRVSVRNKSTSKSESYMILGPWDADIERSVISYMAPLGRSLLGKSPGDVAVVELPSGSVEYIVESIANGMLSDVAKPS